MDGLLWTIVVWTLAFVIASVLGRRRHGSDWGLRPSRGQVAIAIVLLGTHTFAAKSTAEEILRDPVVLERVVRLGLAGLALLVILPLLIHRARWGAGRVFPGLTALSVYWLVGVLSILYSVAPIVSLGKAFELGVGLSIVWTIARGPDAERRLDRGLEFVVFLEVALVVGAVVGFVVLPDRFSTVLPRPGFLIDRTMVAPYAASNALSAGGGLIAAYSLARLLRASSAEARVGWAAVFVGGTFGVVLASGRQGVIIWLVGVMLLLWLHRRRMFAFLVVPAVAVVVGTYAEDIWTALVRGRAANIVTLSGRVGMWQAALDAWSVHPMTGYGYGAGGRFVALKAIGLSASSNVHSGYVETLVGLGILGMIPLLFAAWRVLLWSVRRLRSRTETHLAILILPLLLHASVSQGFAAWLNEDFMLFALLCGLVAATADSSLRDAASVPDSSGAGSGQ